MVESGYTYKDSAYCFMFSLVAFLGTSVIFSLVIGAIAVSSGTSTQELLSIPLVNILSGVLSEIAFFLTFIIYNISQKKNFLVDTTLKNRIELKTSVIIVLFSLAIILCSLNFTGLLNYLFSTFAKPDTSTLNIPLDTFPQFLLGSLVLAILPAVCEELIFRGIILNGFFKKFKPMIAIIFSAGLFALIHLSIYSTVHQFILGLELGLILYLTGSIFYCMLFHFVNNFLVVLINFCFKNGFSLEITSWGGVQVIITILAFLLGILITWLICRFLLGKNKKEYASSKENYIEIEDNDYGNNSNDIVNSIMLAVSTIFCLVIWITNSFGG